MTPETAPLPLADLRYGFPASPLFLGQRSAPREDSRFVRQLFLDLPRTEPRVFQPPQQNPPDLSDPETLRDKEATVDREADPPGLFFLRPYPATEGELTAVPDCEAFLDHGSLSLSAGLELCFDGPACVRVRGRGNGLRIFAPLLDHEAAVDRQDGTFQVCFEASCEVLFVPLRGRASMDNPWSLWHGGTQRLLLTLLPDADGVLELAVHVAPTGTERFATYRPFDQCLREVREKFDSFLAEHGLKEGPEAYCLWAPTPPENSLEARMAAARAAWNQELDRLYRFPLCAKTPGPHLLGSTEAFDLRSVPFSRRGSFLCILEDDTDRSLYLSVTRSPEMWSQRLSLIRLTPCLDGQPLPFEYEADAACLTVRTAAGALRFAFDAAGRLHVRGSGPSLRLSFRLLRGENALPRERSAWQVSFHVLGGLLCAPLEGRLFCDAAWNDALESPGPFSMVCAPAGGAFHLLLENSLLRPSPDTLPQNDLPEIPLLSDYPTFDECVMDAERDFVAFSRRFPALPDRYAPLRSLAAWVIWIHSLGPSGDLLRPVQYMTRTQWTRAFGWQQSFHAMAARSDPAAAWQLLLTIFDYLSPAGQLPDSVGDIGRTYRVTKPALQGLALLYLLDRCDFSAVPLDQVRELYNGMSRFASWWFTCRDRCGSGLPQYFHADESPGEFCSLFAEGVPLYSADLAAFVALLAEGCARLAGRLNLPEEETRWSAASRSVIDRMISHLWDGERFQARLVSTDEIVPSHCVLATLPVMLGDRLPPAILSSLISRLSDEQEYLAPHGISLEPLSERKGDGLPQGTVAFISALFAVALAYIGRKDLAREIARRSADQLLESGFGFLTVPGPKDTPVTDPTLPRRKSAAPVSKWSSWTCACYIILADLAR